MTKLQLFLFVAIFVAATGASNPEFPGLPKLRVLHAQYKAWLLYRKPNPVQEILNLMNLSLTQLKNHPKTSMFGQQVLEPNLQTNVSMATESLYKAVLKSHQMIQDYESIFTNSIHKKIHVLFRSIWDGILSQCYETPVKILKDALHVDVDTADCVNNKIAKDGILYINRMLEAHKEFNVKSIEIAEKSRQCIDVLESEIAICSNDALNQIAGIYIETVSTIKKAFESMMALFEPAFFNCEQTNKLRTLEWEIEKMQAEMKKCQHRKRFPNQNARNDTIIKA